MKSFGMLLVMLLLLSPPSRGAWIEILSCCVKMLHIKVAPLAGGVD